MTYIHIGLKRGNHWQKKNKFLSNVKANKEAFEIVLSNWVRTPEQYRNVCLQWRRERKDMGELPIYDYVPLRETPLIEAQSSAWVCPVPAFLFSKIENEPFFIISDYLKKLKKSEMHRFHTSLGYAYEEYAHGLVDRIAKSDRGGEWMIKYNPQTKRSGELSDSYLQRGKVVITFEHKGRRPTTEFLRGGEGELILGPSKEIIRNLENKYPVNYKDGCDNDEGFITKGIWQQSKAGPKLILWAEKEFGVKPDHVYPLITLLSSLVVDPVLRKVYLIPLILRAGLYKEDFWEKPQWLHVSDLEALASMAENGDLDLESLLREKVNKYGDKRFDLFLYDKNKTCLGDRTLVNKAMSLLDNAALTFFKKGFNIERF